MKTYRLKIKDQIYNYIVRKDGSFESNYPYLNIDLSRKIDLQIKKENIKNNQCLVLKLE